MFRRKLIHERMIPTMQSNHYGDSKYHDLGKFLQRRLLCQGRLHSWHAAGGAMLIVVICALAHSKEWRPTLTVATTEKEVDDMLMPRWKPGMLDIHHLRVGPSQSSFVIFPDATTMMIDAGTVPINQTLGRVRLRPGFEDLEIRASWPNSSKSPAEWIADYVHHFWPSYPRPSSSRPEPTKKLDFFLLSHFHSDHMGDPTPESRVRGSHRLTGLTELASILPIGTLVDRDYPLYNIPMNLSEWGSAQFDNYAAFVKDGQDFDRIERFDVGSNEQFALKKDRSSTPLFVVRNIKSNLEVWDSKAGKAIPIPGELFTVNKPSRKKWDENELSTAIVIEYGDFRYYEGGDQEQHVMPEDESIGLDSISPTALAAGFVDVATANHHGRGTNQAFCDLLDPAVVILQGLWSDQPLQSTMEFLTQPRRNLPGRPKRLLFVTDVFQKRLDALGETLAGAFAGMNGHVVVRVHPPGQSQTYEIFLLDRDRKVTARHGPFIPKQHSGKQKAS